MRFPSCWSRGLPLLLLLPIAFGTHSARAAGVELISSDDRGLTLRLELPGFTIRPPGKDGSSRLNAPGLDVSALPGRPELPFAAALIALPPEAGVRARVVSIEGEELHDGIALRIGRRPGFEGDGTPSGTTPTLEEVPAIEDGAWPPAPFQLGEPFTVRRQRLVAVHLNPFRYDAASRRLWSIRSLTVRVEFQGRVQSSSVPADDRHWEPVLKTSVLNYEQGRRWRVPKERGLIGETLFPRTRPLPGERAAGAGAFDESEPEVRVQIDTTGVSRLDYDRLASHDYPSGVPVAEVSVHRHEYVQDAPPGTPPYVTIELPIEVVDRDGNGIFGTGDYILLFVQSWGERSRASIAQRVWGDGEVVYATVLRGGLGRRITSRSGWRDQDLTPLASYPWRERFERNLFYLPVFQIGVADTNTDQFHWTELGQFPSTRADSFAFLVNDLDTTHQATISVTWQGRKANTHFSWAHVRNFSNQFTSVVDSASWIGRGSFTAGSTLFGSALSSGTNLLRVWGKTSNSENQIVNAAVNYFDVSYWREFRPLSGLLSCNSADATGEFEIEVPRFRSRDIRVYDVTDSLNPVRLILADSLITPPSATFYTVRFQDSSPTGARRHYVVFDSPRIVPADHYHTVTRRRLTERAAGDYLLIVPEVFLPAVDPLVTHRTAQGLNVVVAPLESVNDEFNGGRRSSHAIKRFIRHAYLNWDAQFVLLVGDGTEDPHNYTGTAAPDWVPVQRVLAPVGVYDGASNVQEAIASDPWYVWCVEGVGGVAGNCPDSLSKLHDLFIGRLPVNSLQQATDVVSKLIAYENVTPDQTWRREMLLVADDAYSTQSFFGGGNPGDIRYCYRSYEEVFLEISEDIRSLILNQACLSQAVPEVFDLGQILENEPRDPDDPFCRESWSGTQQRTQLTVTPQLIQKLNAGKLWFNFQGHANPFVLTHEDLYVNRGSQDNKDLLMNTGKPFFFSGFSCHPNQFSSVRELQSNAGPALGEEMPLLPNRGAIACWGSSGFEILPTNGPSHLNVHLARALFDHAPFDPRLGGWDGRVVLGEAVGKALLDNRRTTFFSLERDVGISYNLLGDPATRLSVGSADVRGESQRSARRRWRAGAAQHAWATRCVSRPIWSRT